MATRDWWRKILRAVSLEVYDSDFAQAHGPVSTRRRSWLVRGEVRLVDEALSTPARRRATGLASPQVTSRPRGGNRTSRSASCAASRRPSRGLRGGGRARTRIRGGRRSGLLYGVRDAVRPLRGGAACAVRGAARHSLRREQRPASNPLHHRPTLGGSVHRRRCGSAPPTSPSRNRRPPTANRVKKDTADHVLVIGNPPVQWRRRRAAAAGIEERAPGGDGRARPARPQRWIAAAGNVGRELPYSRAPLQSPTSTSGAGPRGRSSRRATCEATGREEPEGGRASSASLTRLGLLSPGRGLPGDCAPTCGGRAFRRLGVIETASPEGHQPEVATRLFQGVQHPVCIVLAARRAGHRPGDARPGCASAPWRRGGARRSSRSWRGSGFRGDGWAELRGGLARAVPAGAGGRVGHVPARSTRCSPTMGPGRECRGADLGDRAGCADVCGSGGIGLVRGSGIPRGGRRCSIRTRTVTRPR